MSSEQTAHGSTAHQDEDVQTSSNHDALVTATSPQPAAGQLSIGDAHHDTATVVADQPMIASTVEAAALHVAEPHTTTSQDAPAVTETTAATLPKFTVADDAVTVPVAPASSEKVPPADKPETLAPAIEVDNVELLVDILVSSGLRRRFTFGQNTGIGELLAYIFKNWPEEWTDRPQELKQLRLLHRGHFLQDSTRLSACRVEGATTVVMHLYVRPIDAEAPAPVEKESKGNKHTQTQDTHSGGCCGRCIIM